MSKRQRLKPKISIGAEEILKATVRRFARKAVSLRKSGDQLIEMSDGKDEQLDQRAQRFGAMALAYETAAQELAIELMKLESQRGLR